MSGNHAFNYSIKSMQNSEYLRNILVTLRNSIQSDCLFQLWISIDYRIIISCRVGKMKGALLRNDISQWQPSNILALVVSYTIDLNQRIEAINLFNSDIHVVREK